MISRGVSLRSTSHFLSLRALWRPLLLVGCAAALPACGNSLLQSTGYGSNLESSGNPQPGNVVEVEFTEADLQQWDERSFAGHTQYSAVIEDDRSALQATTDATASLLFRQQVIDLTATPMLEWSWKISDIYADDKDAGAQGGDGGFERTRSGDDFPARIYVVYQPGILPTEARAINYVWSSREPVGDYWPNPFQPSATMLVVESGAERIGQWITISRNVRDDFKRLHGIDTDSLHGFAVMVDGDNTGSATTSWFDYLKFTDQSTGNTAALVSQ